MSDSNSLPLQHPLLGEAPKEPTRQPHRCCFCGCNMRESTIAVSFFFGIFFPAMFILAWTTGYYKNYTTNTELIAKLDVAFRNDAIINGVGILVAVCFSILGAFAYSPLLVLIGAAYFVVGNSLSVYYVYPVLRDSGSDAAAYLAVPIGFMVSALYPHLGFVYEVKRGILTRPADEVVPISL